MIRYFLVFGVLFFIFSCSSTYKLNIKINNKIKDKVNNTALLTKNNVPNYKENNEKFIIYTLSYLLRNEIPDIDFKSLDLFLGVRKQLESKLINGDILSYSFITNYKDKRSYQEITTGFIFSSWDDFLKKFNPARDWGRKLEGYLGGELVVDEKLHYNLKFSSGNPATFQRERMVISTPWYTIGASDMDMSKYEVIHYSENEITINWMVTKSENKSVYDDVGYLTFKKRIIKKNNKNQELVQVIFNSIHRVNPGIFSWMIPNSLIDSITRESLEDMFSDDIKAYREVIKGN